MDNPATNSQTTYVYEPLPESKPTVRVIELLPAKYHDDPLQCHLTQMELADEMPYEALSYVWGDPSPTDVVHCEGKSMAIGRNLSIALRALRRISDGSSIATEGEQKGRLLWVDALCIDQANLSERRSQVQLMWRLFKTCRRCVVWLAHTNDESGVALSWIRKIESFIVEKSQIVEMLTYTYWKDLPDNYLDSIAATLRVLEEAGFGEPEASRAMMAIFSLPWFTRLWVFQEATAPRDVVFTVGSAEFSIDAIMFAMWLPMISEEIEDGLNPAEDMIRLLRQLRGRSEKQTLNPLLAALEGLSNMDCQDERDRLYAVLGISEVHDEPSLQPDYTVSTSEVWLAIAHHLLRDNTYRPLDLFSTLESTPRPIESLPSWVPQWPLRPGLVGKFRDYNADFRPGGDVQQIIKPSGDHKTLKLSGRVVDTILDSVPIFPAGPGRWKEKTLAWTDAVLACWTFALRSSFTPVGTSTRKETIWRAICADSNYISRRTIGPEAEDMFDGYLALARRVGEQRARGMSCDEILDDELEVPVAKQEMLFLLGFDDCSGRRRFASTNGGRLGYIPAAAVPGDVVCIFRGAHVPHVLRPVGPDTFEIVGECFVHGIVYGELLPRDEEMSNADDEGAGELSSLTNPNRQDAEDFWQIVTLV